MSEDGFGFKQLLTLSDEYRAVSKAMPKESKKFLQQQGTKLLRKTKRKAKQLVRTDHQKPKRYQDAPHYHDMLKRGKAYFYQGTKTYAIRVYSGARHAHLLEYGHKTTNGGQVDARNVFAKAGQEFERDFSDACETFLDTAVKKI